MSFYPFASARAPVPPPPALDKMCSSPTCPIAARCRRHEASGTRPAERQRFDEWHWRRGSWSEAVVCNGFEAVAATVEAQP